MQCVRPLKASLARDGSVTFNQKQAIPGLIPFEINCRKCLACRLNGAREKAIRCYHEASIYGDENIFLTLTYDADHVGDRRLHYSHFQTFMKDLRAWLGYHKTGQRISFMVTGEYGGPPKILPSGKLSEGFRPHWHAIIFNYLPTDRIELRSTDRGDTIYRSQKIQEIWGKGDTEFGTVTLDSANYVARYAAKKLTHGNDDEHNYHPLHRTSCKNAIGRNWIERYYKQTFLNGYVVLPNGEQAKIPRYYIDWCKKHQPDLYLHYYSNVVPQLEEHAKKKAREDELRYLSNCLTYKGGSYPLKRNKIKETILKSKFKQLQERLKL